MFYKHVLNPVRRDRPYLRSLIKEGYYARRRHCTKNTGSMTVKTTAGQSIETGSMRRLVRKNGFAGVGSTGADQTCSRVPYTRNFGACAST